MADAPARVAIVGVGQSVHAARRTDVSHGELAHEAISAALDDAGVELADIDGAVTASLDFWDGRTIANMAVSEVVGSYLKPEARVCGDGAGALVYASARIRSGGMRLGIVVAHCKESEGRPHDIEAAAFDPFFQRRLDADGDVVAGLAAQCFYASANASVVDAAQAVVDARRVGRSNPYVEALPEITVDDVLESEPLTTPLRILDKAPLADGACALVVATEEVARTLDVDPVWVVGMAGGNDKFFSDRDLASTAMLENCVTSAVSMAGWSVTDADLVEYSAQFSFQMLAFAPAFGAGSTDPPVVNPSGGWLAGNPGVVTGLSRTAECVVQIRGTAGERQLPGVRRALAHGMHGLGAQAHTVVALDGGVS